jgi:hypothetical protein
VNGLNIRGMHGSFVDCNDEFHIGSQGQNKFWTWKIGGRAVLIANGN